MCIQDEGGHFTHLMTNELFDVCLWKLLSYVDTTPGIPVTEEGNVYSPLTEVMVHPIQGVKHYDAEGCTALGSW